MFMSPSERSFGEAYIDADFDVEGDLNAVFPLVDYLRKRPLSVVQNLRMIRLLLSLPRPRATRSGRAAPFDCSENRTRRNETEKR